MEGIAALTKCSQSLVFTFVLALLFVSGCRSSDVDHGVKMSLTVTSPDLIPNGLIPAKFTCAGTSISPALNWTPPPKGTASLALVVSDRDSLLRPFIHWTLYNVPANTNHLEENIPHLARLADGSDQGTNGDNSLGYFGPYPPAHSTHRYSFELYALDTSLQVAPGATEEQLLSAMKGHILAAGELVGRYHR